MRIEHQSGMRALLVKAGAAALVSTGVLVVAMPHASAVPNWQVDISCTGDVVLPGEPGDAYTFTFAASCYPEPGVFAYVYNKLPDGDGWVTGTGFLSVPSNLASFYNSHTYMEGWPVNPSDWYSSAISNPGYVLTPMTAVELQSENYQGATLGDPGSVVGAVSVGLQWFAIRWGSASPGDSSGTGVPDPTFTLTSNAAHRGTCWPTVTGRGGTWVQLTDSGCVPPTDGATLLGWATSPDFPVARARNGVAVDEAFDGVRMIFIPLNGYTLLTGDNSLYPIWGA